MKSIRIWARIKTAIYFISFAAIMAACETEQGMMFGGGSTMDMGYWNWLPMLISLGIGFLLGYLLGRRSK